MEHLPLPFKDVLWDVKFVPAYLARPMQLNWKFFLLRGKENFSCAYSQGIGHIPARHPLGRPFVRNKQDISEICDRGHGLNKPRLQDILSCLQLDCSVRNYTLFEDWADEYDYDRDSREAERIYNACLKTYRELRQCLGRELFEVFANYDFENAAPLTPS